MEIKKIRTEEDFKDKLLEIGGLFGVEFEIEDDLVYVIGHSGKKVKMKTNRDHYTAKIDGKHICFRYIFAPHYFSTSVLIEVFMNDGKKYDCCKIEQELRPQSGIREYPTFTYNSYEDGVTHLFYSNSFLIETADTNGMNIHIFEAIKKYENNGNINPAERFKARFTKPNINRFLCGVDDFECDKGDYSPYIEFEAYRGRKGHNYKLWVLSGDCKIYQDITSEYRYNPEGFYAMIPFCERECLHETQYLEELNKEMTQADWDNLYLSIMKNKGAITCFENAINYFSNSNASTYIDEHFGELIQSIRMLQGNTKSNEKSLMKLLEGSIHKL